MHPAFDLTGRTALVTGAGQGVGRGIALALGAAGANVVVAAHRGETGRPVADQIGSHAVCVEADVGVGAEIERAVAAAVDRFGALDIVIHNAFRGSRPAPLQAATAEAWAPNSRTAMWGSFHCAKAAYAHLRRAGSRGRFVVVTSRAGIDGSAERPFYAAVKGAQIGLIRGLAAEWGRHGITVNGLAPLALTPSLQAAFTASPELEARVRERSLLGRIGDPENDIGPVAVFLASDAAAYVTGQVVMCDGGSAS